MSAATSLTDEDFEELEAQAEEPLPDDLAEWCPEAEPYVDPMELDEARRRIGPAPAVLPSQFTEYAFRFPDPDKQGYLPFSFNGRRHMRRVYDTPANRVLLFCARQVEKSTLLGNRAITYSCMIQGYRTLYVSPSATQAKTFSVDRVKEPIETSDTLKSFTLRSLQQNVFEKQFINRSKITLRYAFLNADRTRGIPANALLLDEFQDIIQKNVPVIEQCTAHSPEHLKQFIYAGTPKSLDNVIEYYRANESTQGEWVVPCDACGSSAGAGRYWNILGEKNIGKTGLICENCGRRIDAAHADAQWAFQVALDPKKTPFESYRVPQLMVPWKPWNEILSDYRRYPRDQFYNEVLGISFDSGLRPLTRQQVKDVCNDEVRMTPEQLEMYRQLVGGGRECYAGLDWGTGANAYTVLSLGMYVGMKFRIFYVHRFVGEDVDPDPQLVKIIQMLRYFNVRIIGSDYGGGLYPNDKLIRTFGAERVMIYQYMAKVKKKVLWSPGHRRWMVHRTDVMTDIFNAIKRKQFEFPRWQEFGEDPAPYAQDMLNIFSEYNKTMRMLMYSHSPGSPDDTFHSILYCFLASMIRFPRPDIVAPVRELPNVGPMVSTYTGPTNQG